MYYARVISYLPYTISENNSMFGLGKEGVTGKKRREKGGRMRNLLLGWSKWASPQAHHLFTPKWR